MKPFALVLCAAFVAGCTASEPAPRNPEGTTILQAQADAHCPLGVPSARVEVADTPGGVSMTFTASPDRIAELRARASDAAAMHGPGQRLGRGHDGKHGSGGEHGLQAMQLPPSHAGAEDIEGGARLNLRPVDPSDLGALRLKARERAAAMSASCR